MVVPTSDAALFCEWLETSGYYRLSTQRLALVAIIKAAAIAGTEVTDTQYNDFIRFTALLYPAFIAFEQLSTTNNNVIPMPRKIVNYQNVDSDHTGDLVETILCSLLIPAGSVDIDDSIYINAGLGKIGDVNACNFKGYFGPTDNSLVGATLISTAILPANTNSARFTRTLPMNHSLSTNRILNTTTSFFHDYQGSTVNFNNVDIDFSIDQYFMISATLSNAADTSRLCDVYLYIDKP